MARSHRAALVLAALLCTTTSYAADFQESEVHGAGGTGNSDILTRDLVALSCGDTISGVSHGSSTVFGDDITTADYWEIVTPAQPAGTFWEYTLTIVTPVGTANTMSIRGWGNTGVNDCANPGGPSDFVDVTAQLSAGGVLRWYGGAEPSRIMMRVTGSGTSSDYTATFGCTQVLPNDLGSFAAGSITITTSGQGHSTDTELEIWDDFGPVLGAIAPDENFHNDDQCPASNTRSVLTRTYSPGTYYLMLGDWQTNSRMRHATDDAFSGGGWLLLFGDTIVNSSTATGMDMSFAIDDGSGPLAVSAMHDLPFEVDVHRFTVVADNLLSYCFGDGGDGMGCTSCPCANDALPGSRGGCLNSIGQGAELLPSGAPDLSTPADSLHFDATGAVPVSFGMLVSGDSRLPASPQSPCFGTGSGVTSTALDGLRCVGGMVLRHGVRGTNALGDIGATGAGWGPPHGPPGGLGAFNGFVAGQTRHFQVFYREDILSSCLTGQNTTQAVSVTFY